MALAKYESQVVRSEGQSWMEQEARSYVRRGICSVFSCWWVLVASCCISFAVRQVLQGPLRQGPIQITRLPFT